MNRTEGLETTLRLTHRSFNAETDIAAWVALDNIGFNADDVDDSNSVEAMSRWAYAVDPANTVLIETPDGELVARAYTWSYALDDGSWNHEVQAIVHPSWRRRGIGHALQAFLDDRAGEMAHARKARGETGTAYAYARCRDQIVDKATVLVDAGYKPVRYAFLMVRDLREHIPESALPEGIVVRTAGRDDMRGAWETWRESMRDRYGYSASQWTDDQYESFITYPGLDPNLWRIACDGSQIVGGCAILIDDDDKQTGPKRGWFDLVGVLRPWRGRGIGAAMVTASLRMLRERGFDQGIISLAADTPDAGFPLFEKLGFHMDRRSTHYRKVIG